MNKKEWINQYEEDLREEFDCRGAEDKYGRGPEAFYSFCDDLYAYEKDGLEDEFEANKKLSEKQEQDFERFRGN